MRKIVLFLMILFISLSVKADSFDKIKQELRQSGCYRLEFLNILESDVFETIDSVYGKAYIASDGRFNIEIGSEVYIADFDNYYSYIPENNQLIIENRDSLTSDEISFIIRLDEIYDTYPVTKDSLYRLIKKKNIDGDHPDSMIVYLTPQKDKMKQIEYYDVNEELNQIIFLHQEFLKECDEKQFEPDFPETVEKVRL